MMWFNGIGWSWAGCFQGVGVVVVLWGAVVTAIILAVGFLTRQRRDPLAEGSARGERDSDEWHRRLM